MRKPAARVSGTDARRVSDEQNRRMSMLLAEDLLLLLLDDAKGTTSGLTVDARIPLGAAVLAELALDGAIEVDPEGARWRAPRIRATGRPVTDEVLAGALAVVAQKPRTAVDLAGRIGTGLKERLGERLASVGVLERREDRVLGLFPRTRWPARTSTHEMEVRDLLARGVAEGGAPDARTAALIGILQALDRLAPTLGLHGPAARAAKRRAKELSKGDWAAKAVRDAVQAAAAAASTAAVAASTTATIG